MMAMGADSTTYPLVYEYGIYIAYGSPLFLLLIFYRHLCGTTRLRGVQWWA